MFSLGLRVHEATKTAAKLACLVAMWRCSRFMVKDPSRFRGLVGAWSSEFSMRAEDLCRVRQFQKGPV